MIDIINTLTKRYEVTFTEASIVKFSEMIQRKEFPKNTMVLNFNDVSKCMYLVKRGLIRQFYYKDDKDVTEHFSSEGDVAACLESLFLKQPSRIAIETIEPTTLYLIDYELWSNDCKVNGGVLMELYRKVMEKMLVVSQIKADSLRFENAQERYVRFCQEYPNIVNRVSIADIASYLIMTPETLSRIRSKNNM